MKNGMLRKLQIAGLPPGSILNEELIGRRYSWHLTAPSGRVWAPDGCTAYVYGEYPGRPIATMRQSAVADFIERGFETEPEPEL